MEIFILYWIFSTLYIIGMNIYNKDVTIGDFIFAIVLGWFTLPISLGTKRAQEIHSDYEKIGKKWN